MTDEQWRGIFTKQLSGAEKHLKDAQTMRTRPASGEDTETETLYGRFELCVAIVPNTCATPAIWIRSSSSVSAMCSSATAWRRSLGIFSRWTRRASTIICFRSVIFAILKG
jgi:hypothetical protein